MRKIRGQALLLIAVTLAMFGVFVMVENTFITRGSFSDMQREEKEIDSSELSSLKTIVGKEYVGMITGSKSKHYLNVTNDTQTDGEVRGTDLGYPVWDSTRNRLLLFFGDTVGEWTEDTAPTSKKAGKKDWRNNVMMVSTDDDYSDGLNITGYLTYEGIQPSGHAIEVIKGHKNNDSSAVYLERSKLPTGGIEIDGTIYMSYMSKYKWGYSIDSISYGGFVKSEDGGVTWSRVNSLSWANHSSGTGSAFGDGTKGLDASQVEKLMNEDINKNLTISKGDKGWIDVVEHEGYFFTTLDPVDGKDGYIYIFGEGAYRSTGVKLARVKKESFEVFEEYEYLQGYQDDEPVWLSYKEGGLANLNDKDSQLGFVLGNNTTGAFTTTVMFNKYLGKWMLSSASSGKKGIFYSLADNIWGPYDYESSEVMFSTSDSYLLERNADGTINSSIYCGYIDEHLTEDNGRIIYIVISQSSPIYESSLVKITFGPKNDRLVKHIVPLEEMKFLDIIDESRILSIDDKQYYCIHETSSFTAFKKTSIETITTEANVNLQGFLAIDNIDNNYIVYMRKVVMSILKSEITIYDGENEIENSNIAWIGYERDTITGKDGVKNGDELIIGENILYNANKNYVYFECKPGYTLDEVKVYKAGDLVSAKIYKYNDNVWYFKPASTVAIYRFEVSFSKIKS